MKGFPEPSRSNCFESLDHERLIDMYGNNRLYSDGKIEFHSDDAFELIFMLLFNEI